MPFDPSPPAQPAPGTLRARRNERAVAAWLLLVAAMVWAMVALGGATRLSGSGLSIMEWSPLLGTLPPLSEAEWTRLYDLYRTIPQYSLQNRGFGMEGFKAIFWLEYLHRLWGRLIGLAFALPLAWFWWQGRIPAGLKPRLLLLLALGGLQGGIGWYMVASGFEAGRTAVSPYRLVLHLGMAFLIFALLLRTALPLLWPAPQGAQPGPRRALHLALGLAVATMLAGGFVAGIRAGFDYNTFPLMAGQFVPNAYFQLTPWWRNLTGNIAAVQFNHRLLATATLLAGGLALALAWRAPGLRGPVGLFAATLLAQYGLGVATLLHVVPQGLGTLHQAVAVGVLAAGLVALHAARPAGPARLG
jgi:cytochrome c oxidase assembly protein subunit 15